MTNKRNEPASDLLTVIGWLAVLWAIFIVDVVLRARQDYFLADDFGLHPRDPQHWWGIFTAHLLHANVAHLAANSLGLLILGWLSCRYSRNLTYLALGVSALTAGILTWLIGSWNDPRPVVHVGASGAIFGLIGFLLTNAIVRFDWRAMVIGVLVGWLFLDALPGMLPSGTHGQPISWEMHLGGFVGGVLTSLIMRKHKPT